MRNIRRRLFSVFCICVFGGMLFSVALDHLVEHMQHIAENPIQIDNVANVENYTYHTDFLSDMNTIPLKDCEYTFCEDIAIPGMPMTREIDYLNRYIFSESQCPQGICFTDEFVLVTSYSEEQDRMGELMVFDRKTGEYLVTLGMDAKSHLGGIAFDGKNVWVCNSDKKTIERISYDFIQVMAIKNPQEVVDATAVVDVYPVENKPSCITYYGGRLWIATHTRYFNSKMLAYHLDEENDKLVALSKYKIPSKVQGIAFDDSGYVYLSTSYGRNKSSYIKAYTSVVALSTKPNNPKRMVEMPPGSEEVDIDEDSLYVIFESAGEKYLEGTDGKGKSLFPLDQILKIEISSIYDE